ncbi:helix-turn-helix transcriptional regulator [Streptomyces synnematoformans]|uniref:Helix-turn-helix transcriptional regulator n=1 Tax=Streptomyces synnematoformans TaxID=415721 RepID=A0ABN2XSB8_9ACTN
MEHPHPETALCDMGRRLYTSALRTGQLSREATGLAPCLTNTGLLRHDPVAPHRLRPAPPSEAVANLIRPLERELSEYRRFTAALAGTVEQLTTFAAGETASPLLTVWKGKDEIEAALLRALDDATEEFLAIQPASGRPNRTAEKIRATAQRVRELHERGVTQRTLYNHTYRHHPATLAYLDGLKDTGLEVRTMDETAERLLIIDRAVAFVPAQPDRETALEIRHPGLVWYLVSVFERFWQIAVPWERPVPYQDTPPGITGVQQKIAQLLVEGHLDEAIARRLGMNIRTCRAHIAKLSAALGSDSRTQLGFLLARSGIVDGG